MTRTTGARAPESAREAAVGEAPSLRVRDVIGPVEAFWEEEVAVTRSSLNPCWLHCRLQAEVGRSDMGVTT
jgi:hypothetical protein